MITPPLRSRYLSRAYLMIAALVFTASSLLAVPLQTVDLASTTAWTYKGETDAGWTAIAMPGQRAAGSLRYIDYQRSITVPNVSATQSTILRFLSVNDCGIVYLDGAKVDSITYSLFPVEMDVTHLVTPGSTHTLTVRCFNRKTYYGGTGYIPVAHNYGGDVGIPRGAFIDVYPEVRIADEVVRPSVVNNNFYYDVWVSNHSTSAKSITIKATLTPWNQGDSWNYPTIADQTVSIPANTTQKISVGPTVWGLGSTSYWWPNIPFDENYAAKLHYIHVSINEGTTRLDSLTQRFGFADYTEGPYYYKINGVKVSMFGDGTQETMWRTPGINYQTAYVNLEGWGSGPNGAKETWKRYLRLGMNCFRFHNSAATEIMLNAADEVGYMTIPESAIRGWDSPAEVWHPVYKPDCIKGMARYYRKHPCVVRYSLDNEWNDATANLSYARQLIDAAVSEDPQRLLSFSQDQGGWEVKYYGTNNIGDGWAMSHYREPPNDTTHIKGVEEMFWGRNGSYKYEIIDCARAAIVYRMRHYAVFTPWTWNNYWCNFVQGSSLANGTYSGSYSNKDRRDNIDGWGSNLIKFVQNCYHIYCSADQDIIQNRISNDESNFFPVSNALSFSNTANVTRTMVMFNNSLSTHQMRIVWETRLDSANGARSASGATNMVTLAAGNFVQPSIVLPLPGTNSVTRTLFFVVKTEVDGAIKFTENRYIFRINNSGATAAVSSLAAPTRKAAPMILYTVTGSRIGEYSGAISGVRGISQRPARGVAIAVTKTGLNLYGRKVIWMQ